MTVTAVELDIGDATNFRLPAAKTRIVAAKFDCGCEWRLLGGGVMTVGCRDHTE